LLALLAAGDRRVRGRLAEEHERTPHVRDFVAAVVLNIDIEVAVGDAPLATSSHEFRVKFRS
jgi:hypothetical protein